ncbi:MAG TPA: iron-containing redox enzyme family protein [Fimbriimonadaceae bacterium]|mgnify:CR=1 FL=1|nr:iron-containing redox enzyme family protein [Fimbriimonadaceae bacterium]
MTRIEQLDQIVSQYDLNGHPFYQDWRMGTLPVDKLRDYASEYGQFIGTIDEGWDRIGFPHYAEEERVHEKLWAQFQLEIASGAPSRRPQTETLVTAARNAFTQAPEAVGALYSFEAQQPNTSRSKLDGLNEHYSISEDGKEYFRVHADDFAEAEDLRKVVAEMSDEDFARAKSACAVVCAAMWSALDGVYYN